MRILSLLIGFFRWFRNGRLRVPAVVGLWCLLGFVSAVRAQPQTQAPLPAKGGAQVQSQTHPLPSGPVSLRQAIQSDQAQLVKHQLALGVSPDTKIDGWPLLALAARFDSNKVAKVLLAAGARPSEVDPRGDPPLVIATDRRNVALVRLLLASGADVNGRGEDGVTSLWAAVSKDDRAIVTALLDAHAEVDFRVPPDGETALMAASRAGYADVAQMLLEHGAQINQTDRRCDSPLSLAKAGGHQGAVQLLTAHGARLHPECAAQIPRKIAHSWADVPYLLILIFPYLAGAALLMLVVGRLLGRLPRRIRGYLSFLLFGAGVLIWSIFGLEQGSAGFVLLGFLPWVTIPTAVELGLLSALGVFDSVAARAGRWGLGLLSLTTVAYLSVLAYEIFRENRPRMESVSLVYGLFCVAATAAALVRIRRAAMAGGADSASGHRGEVREVPGRPVDR